MIHKSKEELHKDFEELKAKVRVGNRFFHYKHPDQFYHIIAIGFIEATEEPAVVYEAEYGDKITWIRTKEEFFAKVTLEDGTIVDRFTKVE